MSNKEYAKAIIDSLPEYKLAQVILFLQGAAISDIEEVEPDEFDLQMLAEAEKENDGKVISLQELERELGL